MQNFKLCILFYDVQRSLPSGIAFCICLVLYVDILGNSLHDTCGVNHVSLCTLCGSVKFTPNLLVTMGLAPHGHSNYKSKLNFSTPTQNVYSYKLM